MFKVPVATVVMVVALGYPPVYAFTPKKTRCWKLAESASARVQFSTVTRKSKGNGIVEGLTLTSGLGVPA